MKEKFVWAIMILCLFAVLSVTSGCVYGKKEVVLRGIFKLPSGPSKITAFFYPENYPQEEIIILHGKISKDTYLSHPLSDYDGKRVEIRGRLEQLTSFHYSQILIKKGTKKEVTFSSISSIEIIE